MRAASVVAFQVPPEGMAADEVVQVVADNPADLIVFSELTNCAYFPLERDERYRAQALPVDGRYVRAVREAARRSGCYILLPICIDDEGVLVNGAVMCGPDGELIEGVDADGGPFTVYAKTHLCDIDYYDTKIFESYYFQRGKQLGVWHTDLGVIGTLICYDRHFPGAWGVLRSLGAEIVCVPIAAPSTTKQTLLAEMQAMALQQGVFVVVSSRAGEGSLPGGTVSQFVGLSAVIGPDGGIVGSADDRPGATVGAVIDPSVLFRIRQGLPLAEHRRPDLYN